MTPTRMLSITRSPAHAYLVLAVGVLAASMAAIFIRLAQDLDVPSLLIAAGRLTIATLILTPSALNNPAHIAQLRSLKPPEVRLIVASGIFLAIHFAAWVTSLEYTTVLISVVLVSTTPIWVALLEVLFLRASLTRPIIAGLIIALTGSVVIGAAGAGETSDSSSQLVGAALSALGAIAVAVYLIIGRRLRPRLSLVPYIWVVYGCAALTLLMALAVSGTSAAGYELEGYVWILLVALIPQLIGHSSFNYALAHLPATFVSVAALVEPVGSATFAFFVFQEKPGIEQVVGSGIIVLGVLLATLGQIWRSAPVQEPSEKPRYSSDPGQISK